MIGDEAAVASPEVAAYALGLGDDALILAQQLGWWISRAPELEEDIALANIALDLLGHARSLLHYAGSADGRTEDDLAYWRGEREFRSRWLFEQPNGDFAHTIVRQLLASTYFHALYAELSTSADPTLAAIAAKAEKEVAYHLDHAEQWMRRLALGTEESRRRTIVALGDLWPYLGELFVDDEAALALPGIAVPPSSLRDDVEAELTGILSACELEAPRVPFSSGGGREGRPSSYLGFLLAEMQVLARQHPGATW
ncbi:1,2-phenylacetyl-CoA epoxidase subunit PaaC [Micromonospora sp. DT81.3]|uniref:1,2-phenylacetyl-CoA epoxidase subunit PaaC n=1 Tax=Micromonospora sp. DT81.3 TaxID=3416523 RepID=UPI003CF32A7A